jgi:hypothetical protein
VRGGGGGGGGEEKLIEIEELRRDVEEGEMESKIKRSFVQCVQNDSNEPGGFGFLL